MATRDWKELFRGEERHLEYKSATAWDDSGKAMLLKHIIAMSNIRDGGTIVVGVKEDDTKSHELESLSEEQLATWDTTNVLQYVNAYVQPGVRLQVCREESEGSKVIVLRVNEFEHSPNVCSRPGPKEVFKRGQILIRSSAAQSQAIETEGEMNDLLALALSKRSETLMRTVRQIIESGAPRDAVGTPGARDDEWNEQQSSLLTRINATRPAKGLFGSRIIPDGGVILPSGDQARFALVQRATPNLAYSHFPHSPYETQVSRAGFIEGIEKVKMYEHEWRLYDDGAFLYSEAMADEEFAPSRLGAPSSGPCLIFARVCYRVGLTFLFAQRLFTELKFDGELNIDFSWTDTKGRTLYFTESTWRPERYECSEPAIFESIRVSMADLESGWERAAANVLGRVLRLFQVQDSTTVIANQLERVRKGQ